MDNDLDPFNVAHKRWDSSKSVEFYRNLFESNRNFIHTLPKSPAAMIYIAVQWFYLIQIEKWESKIKLLNGAHMRWVFARLIQWQKCHSTCTRSQKIKANNIWTIFSLSLYSTYIVHIKLANDCSRTSQIMWNQTIK